MKAAAVGPILLLRVDDNPLSLPTFRQLKLDAIHHRIGVGTAGSNTITVAGQVRDFWTQANI